MDNIIHLNGTETGDEIWQKLGGHTLFELPHAAIIEGPDGEKVYQPIDDDKVVIRSDGKYLATVGKGYHLEQPREVADDFVTPFLETGLAKPKGAGMMRGGRTMFVQLEVIGAETEVVPNDVIKAYVLAATGFDGGQTRVDKFAGTRVVCRNTLAMAIREKTLEWKVRHTPNMRERIAAAHAEIQRILIAQKEAVANFKALAAKKMTLQGMRTYVQRVIIDDADLDKMPTRTQNKVSTIQDLIENQRGLELVPAARGTAWQAYNAITEWITHDGGARTAEKRLENQWFGEAEKLNRRALEMAFDA